MFLGKSTFFSDRPFNFLLNSSLNGARNAEKHQRHYRKRVVQLRFFLRKVVPTHLSYDFSKQRAQRGKLNNYSYSFLVITSEPQWYGPEGLCR